MKRGANFRTSHGLGLFALYLLLSLGMTYPLPLHLSTHVVSRPDTHMMMWNLWWVKKALLDLGQSPFHTTLIYYPEGVGLVFHSLSPFNGLLSIPLQAIFGMVATYNLLILISFPLSGLAMFLLARRVVKDGLAAFLAGCLFIFSPYRFSHISWLELISTQWLLFFIFCFLASLQEGSKRRWALLSGLLLGVVGYCSYPYLYFSALFVAFTFLYVLFFRRRAFVPLFKSLTVMGFVATLLLLPFFYALYHDVKVHQYEPLPLGGLASGSARPLLYLVPPETQTLYHPLFSDLNRMYARNEEEEGLFTGYLLLGLALWGLLRGRREELKSQKRFWALSALFFFILSLGPFLQAFGRVFPAVKLPYYLLYRFLPFIGQFRTPLRLGLMVELGLCLLASMGLWEILGENNNKKKAVTGLLLLGLCLVEFAWAPLPLQKIHVPEFYKNLGKEGSLYAIRELPSGNEEGGHYMFYQTVHGKRLMEALVSRLPKGLALDPNETDDLRYVIIHRQFFPKEEAFEKFKKPFDEALSLVKAEEGLWVYRVQEGQKVPPYKYAFEPIRPIKIRELQAMLGQSKDLLARGRPKEAVELLQRLENLLQSHIEERLTLAQFYLSRSQLPEVQEEHQKASHLTSLLSETYSLMSQALSQQGFVEEAEEAQRKAEEVGQGF